MARCLQGIDLDLILGEFTGEPGTVYPRFKRIGEPIKFTSWYALVGLELSSSLTIFNGRGALAVVIGKEQPYLDLSKGLAAPIIHLTAQNSFAGDPPLVVPTSKVTPLSFGAFGLGIPPGKTISFYASCDDTAGNLIFGTCSLQLTEVRSPGSPG